MTFDPTIPQPRDILSDSQSDLLTNFGQLNTQFAVNHVAFNDGSSDKGKHKFITFVEQADDPESQADEHLLYTKDDSGDTEIYGRPESNGTAFQMTKDGALYLGMLPFAAVNFDSLGAIQGTALNVSSVSVPTPGSARFIVNFTNNAPDTNYFWSCSGFDNSSNPVIGQPTNSATYSDIVKVGSLQVDFKNQNNTLVTGLTRACVIVWRFQ
jgi:hypothetical protein